MNSERKLVVIARELLPAGRHLLEERYEVRSGGLTVTAPELRELVRGAHALVADASVRVDEALLDAAGRGLRVVANFAVGHDNVDLAALRHRNVILTSTPDVLTTATAELAVALTLAAGRLLGDAERDLREGRWHGWDPAAYRGIELSGATVGVVGLGRIGTRYAELVFGFGASLLYCSPSPKPKAEGRLGARRLELSDLLGEADVVSLHAPATPETRHLINRRTIGLMGREAVLVNTARGALVETAALVDALHAGELGAAGLDVYENEPEVPAKLLGAPRAVLTPHIGSATRSARDAMARRVAENVIAALGGREPPNPVATSRLSPRWLCARDHSRAGVPRLR